MSFSFQNETAEIVWQQLLQVSLAIAVASVVTVWLGRRKPHLAYLLWLLMLCKCVTPPLWSSPTGVFSWSQAQITHASPRSAPVRSITSSAPMLFENPSAAHEPTTYAPSASANETQSTMESASIRWTTWLFVTWLGGAIAIFAYLLFRWAACQQVVRGGRAIEPAIQEIYQQQFSRSGLRRKPRIVVVDEPLGPAAIGCLFPTIIVPHSLLQSTTKEDWGSIFAHELAHIRRGDVWASWLQVAAVCTWWFHPLVWYANRQVVRWRESACDEEVIANLAVKPRSYVNTLLTVMEARIQPLAAMQIGMANGEQTEKRFRRLMHQTRFSRKTPAWCWLVSGLVAALLLPGAALDLNAQQADAGGKENADETVESADFVLLGQEPAAEPADEDRGVLVIVGQDPGADPAKDSVIEASVEVRGVATAGGRPVSSADVEIYQFSGAGLKSRHKTQSDAKGEFTFPKLSFRIDRSQGMSEGPVYVVGRDANGVRTWRKFMAHATGGRIHFTDADGGWATFVSEQDAAKGVDETPVELQLPFPTKHGSVSGRILKDGKPIAGATVFLAAAAMSPNPRPGASFDSDGGVVFGLRKGLDKLPTSLSLSTKTASDGTWTLGRFVDSMSANVAVEFGGATTVASHIPGKNQDVALPKLVETRLRVVDEQTAKPISGSRVQATVRANETMYTVDEESTNDGYVQVQLPAGTAVVQIAPPRVNPNNNYWTEHTLAVSDEDASLRTLTLRTGTRTTISVVDADTGKGIPYLAASPTPSSGLEFRLDGTKITQGITTIHGVAKQVQFVVPGAQHMGYDVVNPMQEAMQLTLGGNNEYTFRLRKMKSFRPPVEQDDLAKFSPQHQATVKNLRELGVIVRSNLSRGKKRTAVTLAQFWKGTASDLRLISELDGPAEIMTLAYPVPKVLRTETKPEAPLVTDETLRVLGECKNLAGLQVSRSSITDAGLAALRGCDALESLVIVDSKVRGDGLAALSGLSVHNVHLKSSKFDMQDADLSGLDQVRSYTFFAEQNEPIIPPKNIAKSVEFVTIVPADDATIRALSARSPKYQLVLGGKQITDESIAELNKLTEIRSLVLMDTSVTQAGEERLRRVHPKLRVINR